MGSSSSSAPLTVKAAPWEHADRMLEETGVATRGPRFNSPVIVSQTSQAASADDMAAYFDTSAAFSEADEWMAEITGVPTKVQEEPAPVARTEQNIAEHAP